MSNNLIVNNNNPNMMNSRLGPNQINSSSSHYNQNNNSNNMADVNKFNKDQYQPLNNTNNQASGIPASNNFSQQQKQQQQQQQQQQQLQTTHFILAGASASGASQNPLQHSQTTLILRRVPVELNRVDSLRTHFAKFGQLVEIECGYAGQADAALIRFANNTQTSAAFKSPQPVFNNRFIRLFWLSSYLKQQQQQQLLSQSLNTDTASGADDQPQIKRLAKDRLSFGGAETTTTTTAAATVTQPKILNKENKAVVRSTGTGSLTKTVSFSQIEDDAAAAAAVAAAAAAAAEKQATTELLRTTDSLTREVEKLTTSAEASSKAAARQLLEENQRKAAQLKLELQKKARQLIEQQIKDQKCLMAKFEQAKTADEKAQILVLIKKLSETIEKEKEILKVGI